jgi:hypothetical protein
MPPAVGRHRCAAPSRAGEHSWSSHEQQRVFHRQIKGLEHPHGGHWRGHPNSRDLERLSRDDDYLAERREFSMTNPTKANIDQVTPPAPPVVDGRLAFSIAQLSAASSVGKTHIYEEIKCGRLKVRKIGKRTLVLAEEARRWIAGDAAADKTKAA